MTAVRLENVGNRILRDIDLTIAEGELFVLSGPSGAGKTTLLQVIAGLAPYQGRIFFDGQCIDKVPPHQRRVGYLFQDLLLFPHLSIRNNLLLAMNHWKASRKSRWKAAQELMELFGIAELSDRFPIQMSGGERQRAALARAIATKPRVLLLDEPFSSLDESNAQHLRAELKKHQRHFKITTLLVTHDRKEACELADRFAVLRQGRLAQCQNPVDKMGLQETTDPVRVGHGSRNLPFCRVMV